jgi:putative ABC transport system ATP-binding protein
MPLVELENVSKMYRLGMVDVWALRDISLEIEEASFVAFVGPSGSGKTTLLNLIGCLDKPTTGRVRVGGFDVSTFDRTQAARFRGENIGFVFQDFNLMPVLTAAENVEYPLIMVQNRPAPEREKRVSNLIEAVGMADRKNQFPDQLSGGQKQRVAVARALVSKPKLLLADEPTANLDRDTAYSIIDLMKRMRDELNTAFIFSTHDPRIIGEAEIVITLEDGRLVSREEPGRRMRA